MVSKPELIKGAAGSIRVGTTGTISSLITKEMDNRNSKTSNDPTFSLPSGSTPRTSLQRRRTTNEASSSSSSSTSTSNISQRSSTSSARQSTHNLPMLGSEDIPLERTPYRATSSNKKGPNIVEVVDIKCGKSEKSWSTPISSRLKKLGFSKLSVSIG
ncbi:hypothetical protein MKX01_030189 [Papaver californicum]|nr:hypothetical protein MKX01_030189 [Papaver californicum]